MDTTRSRRFPAAVLAAVSALLIVVGCSSAPKEPEILAAPNPNMPTIGDFVSVGDLEVRVDDVDQRRSFDPADYDIPDLVDRAAVTTLSDRSPERDSDSDSDSDSGSHGDSDSKSGSDRGSDSGSDSGASAHGPRPTLADGTTATRGDGGSGSSSDSDKDRDSDSGSSDDPRDRDDDGDSGAHGGADATSASEGDTPPTEKMEAEDGGSFGVIPASVCLGEGQSVEPGVQLAIHADLSTVAASGYRPMSGLNALVIERVDGDDGNDCNGLMLRILWVFQLPEDERPSSIGLNGADQGIEDRKVVDLGAGGGEQCEEYNLDLMETELGYWLQSGRLWVDRPRRGLSAEILSNQFDPCAPLSWVTVHLESDRLEPIETVVFFHGPDLVTDPAPLTGSKVMDVTREGADAVSVGVKGGTSSDAPTTTVDYRLEGDKLVESAWDGDDAYPRIDFDRQVTPGEARIGYLGNARNAAYDYRIDWDGRGTYGVRVPVGEDGEAYLNCRLGGRVTVACDAPDGKNWTAKDLLSGPQNDTPEGEPANHFEVDLGLGGGARAYAADGSLPDGGEELPDESVIRFGPYVLSTHGPGLTVGSNSIGYSATLGGPVEETDPPVKVSKSRWPDPESLESWQSA